MLENRYLEAVRHVEEFLSQFERVRPLSDSELKTYNGRFAAGWEIPGMCPDDGNLRIRVLLSEQAPFETSRIAVAPAPPLLSWPHLEQHGLLCLLPVSANFSIDSPASVVQELLRDAQALVHSSLTGDNAADFEDEFESYWSQWERTLKGENVTVICRPEGPSRMVSAYHSNRGHFVAEDEKALRSWLTNCHGKDIGKNAIIRSVPLLWLHRPLRPREYPATVGALRAALADDLTSNLFDATLLETQSSLKLVLLACIGRSGAGFAALADDLTSNLFDATLLETQSSCCLQQQFLLHVYLPTDIQASHPARLIQVRKRTLQHLPAFPQQRLPSLPRHPPPIAVDRRLLLFLARPLPPSPLRLRNDPQWGGIRGRPSA